MRALRRLTHFSERPPKTSSETQTDDDVNRLDDGGGAGNAPAFAAAGERAGDPSHAMFGSPPPCKVSPSAPPILCESVSVCVCVCVCVDDVHRVGGDGAGGKRHPSAWERPAVRWGVNELRQKQADPVLATGLLRHNSGSQSSWRFTAAASRPAGVTPRAVRPAQSQMSRRGGSRII